MEDIKKKNIDEIVEKEEEKNAVDNENKPKPISQNMNIVNENFQSES